MSKVVNISVVGAGLVGSAFLQQLAGLQAKSSTLQYKVVLIAKSNKHIKSDDFSGIKLSSWESELSAASPSKLSPEEIIEFLKKSDSPSILVDNTSNQSLAESYPKFISAGVSIATPNKKAFSSEASLWNAIQSAVSKPKAGLVYHEATVGAGLPILSTLNDMIATGDKIKKIEGIFSGSLSFLFNNFSTIEGSDAKFSDIVLKAKELGYTEPDPRDDLNGLDVARKVTILARLSGFEIESPTSFPVESLIPKELESCSTGDEYIKRLPDFDGEMAKLREQAFKEGKVLRFVGQVDPASNTPISVVIGKYDFSHPFASLKGSDNVISFTTERYPNPLVIQGAGAGDAVTAAGVLGDVIKIAQRL